MDETILKGTLKMVPPVTALKENQRVSVSCPVGHRLRGREALASIALVCQGNPKQLLIEADRMDDVRSLVCRTGQSNCRHHASKSRCLCNGVTQFVCASFRFLVLSLPRLMLLRLRAPQIRAPSCKLRA